MPFYTRGLSIHEFEYIWGSWRASLVTLLVKNPPAMQETLVRFLGWEDPLDKGWLPTPWAFLGPEGAFLVAQMVKNPPAVRETWV